MYISSRTDSSACSMAASIASKHSLMEESQRNCEEEVGDPAVNIVREIMPLASRKTMTEAGGVIGAFSQKACAKAFVSLVHECYFGPVRRRIFLLSPANTTGARAALVHNPGSKFALAQRLRAPRGVPLGEVFSF